VISRECRQFILLRHIVTSMPPHCIDSKEIPWQSLHFSLVCDVQQNRDLRLPSLDPASYLLFSWKLLGGNPLSWDDPWVNLPPRENCDMQQSMTFLLVVRSIVTTLPLKIRGKQKHMQCFAVTGFENRECSKYVHRETAFTDLVRPHCVECSK
jgi:hypothetical protein